MKISLITITFNNFDELITTTHSVHSQTHSDIEHIIIDGGSHDFDPERLSLTFVNDRVVTKIVSEPDDGIYDAMNKGVALAEGDIIGFINSGDVLHDQNVISDVVKNFISNRSSRAIYGNNIFTDGVKITRVWRPGKFRRWKYYLGWMPPHQATFIRKELYHEGTDFDIDLKIAADYKLLLELFFIKRHKITFIDRDIVVMQQGGVSNSSLRNIIYSNLEVLRAWRELGPITPYWIFFLKPLTKIFQLKI